jgi:hypothetical protein
VWARGALAHRCYGSLAEAWGWKETRGTLSVDLAVYEICPSQGDGDSVLLAMLGIPPTLAAHMCRVSGVAPRPVTELVPLAEEVAPVVVTDLGDDGMHDRDLRDMRRVDDQLAAVGDNRLQLVKTLMSSYVVGIIDSTGRYGRSR